MMAIEWKKVKVLEDKIMKKQKRSQISDRNIRKQIINQYIGTKS